MKISLKFFKKLPSKEKRITWATCFTIMRVLAAPFIVCAMIFHHWGFAFWIFVFAAITDLADGFIARNFNQKTFLGACLDPVADKILILSCYFTLAFCQSPLFSIPSWFVWLVLTKEILLIGSAIIFYSINGCLRIDPTILGKSAMAVQVVFVIWLFACYFFHWLPYKTYHFMLGLVVILVLSSLIQYVTIGFRWLKSPLANK